MEIVDVVRFEGNVVPDKPVSIEVECPKVGSNWKIDMESGATTANRVKLTLRLNGPVQEKYHLHNAPGA